ncbi:Murein DD-endopeptidase MepM and murein hydrolase activator NlpD, contain LysM domain [Loktanella atrilutea]|uniref:Murein DD-endopeptidase MepM and murein hydrolase activator NlpD, contain LysM domain n=1 Tax=Loktanella atrilutea TaxID=366533 RepID=A0A1M4U5Y7_LOKAT|nr:peptidoglycan DD-metalloendopeptidase family protein [Loktanella atrilutea]SHE52098.1 Murein DD-endopeptidase MepM and murein hydrolase activator NlpD, contain LysM domain [Loktanella atrilutea]
MSSTTITAARRLALTASVAALLAGCAGGLPDLDLRDQAGGFDTSPAVANLPDRPQPDDRGIISYPGYQVVVARRGDTIGSIAGRLGLDAAALASFNGAPTDKALQQGEVVALPGRVAEPSPATGAVSTGPIQPVDVSAIATTALDRAASTPPLQGGLAPIPAGGVTGAEPIRHKVQPGETAFSISRLYNVPVETLASWNGLSGNLEVRDGQYLLIPQNDRPADPTGGPLVAPGQGSGSPVPPSAAAPLPSENPSAPLPVAAVPPAPVLDAAPPRAATPAPTPEPAAAATPTPAPAPADDGQFVRPVAGSVIRDYAPGKNEGIDIGAPAGTAVKAADAGTVAAVTTDTSGTAIVVVKHAGGLLTVYTNLEGLSVSKGDSVSRGGTLGKVKAGSPSFVHFEVRRGLESVDPNDFL